MPRKSDIANAPNSISTWRMVRGWSIDRLAEKSGLSGATISRIENGGGYTQESLEKIASALRKETYKLLIPPGGSRSLLELIDLASASSEDERKRMLDVIRLLTPASVA